MNTVELMMKRTANVVASATDHHPSFVDGVDRRLRAHLSHQAYSAAKCLATTADPPLSPQTTKEMPSLPP